MEASLIDTHCHLSTLEEPPETVLERAAAAGVTKVVCIGAGGGKKSAADAVSLAERLANVWATVGVHPHDAKDHSELDDLTTLAAHPKVVAVGETGLDYFRDWAPKENQIRLFTNTIAFAKNLRKPLIIHCRDAAEETFDALKKCGAADVGGVFHCYAQDAEFAKRLEEINFIVSFPGSLTFKNASALRETAKSIPLERIMLETDAPYMAPEPFRGKPSEPAHVRQIALKLAEVKGLPLEAVAAITTATARRFFGIE